jgi:tetratricopeptide (TPR) repeat protein
MRDVVAFGISGALFGLLVGWILGSQQGGPVLPAGASAIQGATPAGSSPSLDETRIGSLEAMAESSPSDAATRVTLGNLYFDAEQYAEAIRWYEEALAINAGNVSASTDLAIAFYRTNQIERALAQFDHSLSIDPTHANTLLNLGRVRAFAEEDLAGAIEAWERVIEAAPGTPESRAAQQSLDSVRNAHPDGGVSPPLGP